MLSKIDILRSENMVQHLDIQLLVFHEHIYSNIKFQPTNTRIQM